MAVIYRLSPRHSVLHHPRPCRVRRLADSEGRKVRGEGHKRPPTEPNVQRSTASIAEVQPFGEDAALRNAGIRSPCHKLHYITVRYRRNE